MTITTSQLDELEANARAELDDGNYFSVPVDATLTLQLVAIARAALAVVDATAADQRRKFDALADVLRGAP